MNSNTGSNLTMTVSCILPGCSLDTDQTGLYLRCKGASSPPPFSLWLLCRDHVEKLEVRIKILKDQTAGFLTIFCCQLSYLRKLFYGNTTKNQRFQNQSQFCLRRNLGDCYTSCEMMLYLSIRLALFAHLQTS